MCRMLFFLGIFKSYKLQATSYKLQLFMLLLSIKVFETKIQKRNNYNSHCRNQVLLFYIENICSLFACKHLAHANSVFLKLLGSATEHVNYIFTKTF